MRPSKDREPSSLAPSPTVVLIHGMWCNHDTMHEVESALLQVVENVKTISLPFHHPSTVMSSGERHKLSQLGLSDYVNHCLEEISSIKQPIILVGHSMGGLIAQLIAQSREVSGLILLSSAAPAGINTWSLNTIATLGKNLFKVPLWKHVTRLTLRNVQFGIANSQSSEIQKTIARSSCLESGRASWQIAMWFLYRRPSSRVDESKITCPVLIIAGQQDRITPLTMQKKINQKYCQSTLVSVPNLCHWTIGGTAKQSVYPSITKWISNLPL